MAKDFPGDSHKLCLDEGLERTHHCFCDGRENIQKSAEF